MSKVSSMPPPPAPIPYGRVTSDRYGTPISISPEKPVVPVETHAASTAPTCDRWGHIISTPAVAEAPAEAIKSNVGQASSDVALDWE